MDVDVDATGREAENSSESDPDPSKFSNEDGHTVGPGELLGWAPDATVSIWSARGWEAMAGCSMGKGGEKAEMGGVGFFL